MPGIASSHRFLQPEQVAKLQRIDLVARTVVEGFLAGRHRSKHHGFSLEFGRHREYARGDDPRRLDWRVWARTDRHYVKEYEAETSMRVYLLLDTSASMGYGSGPISKLQYGCYLAASLAYLAIRQKDPTGLALFGATTHQLLPPRLTSAHLRRLLIALETAKPTGRTSLSDSLRAVAERWKRRGLVVLLSDLLADPHDVINSLAYFRHKKHEVVVMQLLDPAERMFPFDAELTFADMETRDRISGNASRLRASYLRELDALLNTYRRSFAANKIEYTLMEASAPFELALGEYLRRRARLS